MAESEVAEAEAETQITNKIELEFEFVKDNNKFYWRRKYLNKLVNAQTQGLTWS